MRTNEESEPQYGTDRVERALTCVLNATEGSRLFAEVDATSGTASVQGHRG